MAGPRNRYGVNYATDCYRTVDGKRYIAWLSFPSESRIKKYRSSGVACRRFGEELFIFEDHQELASEIDANLRD